MLLEPENLVGTWRRFGPVGPVYEIIGLGQELPDHDRMMRARVVETGEEVDYRLTDILNDPLDPPLLAHLPARSFPDAPAMTMRERSLRQ